FTTLEPVLGTLERDDRQLVIADIPGLIEGASGGAGLGHEFLAHVERTRLLVHVLDIAPLDGSEPARNYATVERELHAYGAGLAEPEVEHRLYRPAADEGFEVARNPDGSFRVTGPRVERLIARHDTGNEEALAYVEDRLRAIGVIGALEAAGFSPGDDVEIGGVVFELDPGAPLR